MPEQIDERVDYTLAISPDCGGRTRPLDLAPRVVQQVEIVSSPIEASRRWLERIWSMMATCAQTGRSAFAFLDDAVQAFFDGQPTPSLLPDTS